MRDEAHHEVCGSTSLRPLAITPPCGRSQSPHETSWRQHIGLLPPSPAMRGTQTVPVRMRLLSKSSSPHPHTKIQQHKPSSVLNLLCPLSFLPAVLAICPNSPELWIYVNCKDQDSANWERKWVLKQVCFVVSDLECQGVFCAPCFGWICASTKLLRGPSDMPFPHIHIHFLYFLPSFNPFCSTIL
jgi:hypothetical protein